MRFLLSFLFVIILFSGAIVAFVLPREQLQGMLERVPTGWLSGYFANEAGNDQPIPASTGISAPPLSPSPPETPAYETIRKAGGIPVGDWLYDCEDGNKSVCVVAYQIADKATGNVTFSWLIGSDPTGKFQAVWQTPTSILVNRGIVLDAGTDKPITLPFTACVPGFCEAAANLAPDFIETLLKTNKASATVQAVSGKALTFDISVDGLADGIIALKRRSSGG